MTHSLLEHLHKLNKELKIGINFSKDKNKQYLLLEQAIATLGRFIINENNSLKYNSLASVKGVQVLSRNILKNATKALGVLEKLQAEKYLRNENNCYLYGEDLYKNLEQEYAYYKGNGLQKILFIGSGAMPITAFYLASHKNAKITCMDIDPEALLLARAVSKKLGINNIEFVSSLGGINISKYTHIILASLITKKEQLAKKLENSINANAQLIIRYGSGIKELFNHTLSQEFLDRQEIQLITTVDTLYNIALLKKGFSNEQT